MSNAIDDYEEVNLANLYVGIVADNVSVDGLELGIGMSTFAMLEKQDFEIGELGASNRYTIYKDLGQDRYSYVDQDGNVFIPKGNKPYPASNHLRTVKEMRSIEEILRTILEEYGETLGNNPSVSKAIASYQKIVDSIEEARRGGMRPMGRVGEMLGTFDRWVNLYIAAYGNPLDRDKDDEYLVRTADESELEEESISYTGTNVIKFPSR